MQIIISPAKNQEYADNRLSKTKSTFNSDTNSLISSLKELSEPDLELLMKLSNKLAELNYHRYKAFNDEDNPCHYAALAFTGEVYRGLNAAAWSEEERNYAQDHLTILSGLYGVLKPFDHIQPHRLEMGTKLQTSRGKNLYEFWGDKIQRSLQDKLKGDKSPILINLASNEYNKAAHLKTIGYKVITPEFKEERDGKLKAIMTYAKKARGSMASFIIRNKIESIEALKTFDTDGYTFNETASTPETMIFSR